MYKNSEIEKKYTDAEQKYASLNVDTDSAIGILKHIPISIHCWQADDVTGFEKVSQSLSGGIISTGNFYGRPRDKQEFVNDIDEVFKLVPGPKKLNLHAIYGDFKDKFIDRNEILPEHFDFWIDWAKSKNAGLDFNPTPFSHPMASSGYTIASMDKTIRDFWIEHIKRCREISDYIGEKKGRVCIFNIWIPDGEKDITVSRLVHRNILEESLDEIFKVKYKPENMLDSLESKLFGIGSESYVVGSNEFYLGYALKNNLLITLDTGHFHQTESLADKISSIVTFVKGIVMHISRGIRWDSDHVTVLSDETVNIAQEVIRAGVLEKVYFGTDFFDGSINRIGAYVIGIRAFQKALLYALLEPVKLLQDFEKEGRLFERLATLEFLKTMPFGDIWNYYCSIMDVPDDTDWIKIVREYEDKVLSKR